MKGFRENVYINYKGDRDALNFRLRQTPADGKVPEELIQEVNKFYHSVYTISISIIDKDVYEEVIETDSEPEESSDNESDDESEGVQQGFFGTWDLPLFETGYREIVF